MREFPDGKRFAFTIIDDTDVATVENIAPVYHLLLELGLRCSKTVWAVPCPEGSRNFAGSQTLDDAAYREFMIELHGKGMEMAFHGATMESSRRERTVTALERFRETFGAYPRVHANHSFNQENLYWGSGRVDQPVIRALYGRLKRDGADFYQGHVEGSAWWWGDLCRAHFSYVRNLTFNEVNLLRVNPSLPYHDARRPLVPYWFSATDAEDADEFVERLSPAALDRLEAEGGVCILATHLGKGFAPGGRIEPAVRRVLEDLARRPGWFVPVGPLLDRLRAGRTDLSLPPAEWRAMQWRWARDLVRRKRLRRRRRSLRHAAPTRSP